MRSSVRRGLGAAGVLATALGILAIVSPALVTGTPPLSLVADAVADVGVRTLILAGCVAVALYLLRAAGRSTGERTISGDGRDADRFDRLRDAPPERVTASEQRRTAGDFDAQVDRAVAGDEWALESVRERLIDATVASLGGPGAGARESAERAVASGTWTTDPVAAAFLSGPRGPQFSLRARIRLWLDPETERRRRVERTVRAIETTDVHGPPPAPTTNHASGGRARAEADRSPTDDRGPERDAGERESGRSNAGRGGPQPGRSPTGASGRAPRDGERRPVTGRSGGSGVRGDGGRSRPSTAEDSQPQRESESADAADAGTEEGRER